MYEYEYPRPMVTVDVVVHHCGEVLLIKRKNGPFKDMWALPGGYMDMGEPLIVAAQRELAEETSLKVVLPKFTYESVLDDVDRDPRGRTLSFVFSLDLWQTDLGPEDAVASDDAIELMWFDLKDLPESLAFDHTDAILWGNINYEYQGE